MTTALSFSHGRSIDRSIDCSVLGLRSLSLSSNVRWWMWFAHWSNIMSVLILKYNQPVVYRASGLIAFYNLPHTKMIKHADDDPSSWTEEQYTRIHSFILSLFPFVDANINDGQGIWYVKIDKLRLVDLFELFVWLNINQSRLSDWKEKDDRNDRGWTLSLPSRCFFWRWT